jgi:hypothetical protein
MGLTLIIACFELADSVSRIITPAFVHASTASSVATRAVMLPSPVSVW